MGTRTLFSSLVIGLSLCVAGANAQQAAVPQPPADPSVAAPASQPPASGQAQGYSWADSCKSCHQDIYDSWAKTRHSTALDRLSSSEQEKECVGCHVTGSKTRVMDGRKVLNAGVQCESCHGAAAAHAADPTVKTGLVRKPPQSVCVECHSDKSPHFRGFFYSAMVPIVHKISR
jgi:hypothetical protein